MIELIQRLKGRDNPSHKFFETLLLEFKNPAKVVEAKRKLASCFSIIQYANFRPEEEKLLGDIIDANLE